MSRMNYNYGNTAKNIDLRTAVFEEPTHRALHEIKGEKLRERKTGMSVLYVLFLVCAMVILCVTLVKYISLQAEITATANRISAYEQELNNLTLANDDEYSKIVKKVDLDEIRRVAVEELGMVYPDESQVITYTRENSDYVRQLSDIPD